MYISRMLYLLLLSLLSPLLPSLPLVRPPIWYCHQKFKTTSCTSLLPFPLLLPLFCSCNTAAATRLLQRGCCNADAASSAAAPHWPNVLLLLLLLITLRPLRFIKPIIVCLKLNSWNAHLYFMPTSSDSISGVQLEIIRRATGRFQKTYHSLIWTPPLVKISPSRHLLKFFGVPATLPPMSLMIFATAYPYLISEGPWLESSSLACRRRSLHERIQEQNWQALEKKEMDGHQGSRPLPSIKHHVSCTTLTCALVCSLLFWFCTNGIKRQRDAGKAEIWRTLNKIT